MQKTMQILAIIFCVAMAGTSIAVAIFVDDQDLRLGLLITVCLVFYGGLGLFKGKV